VKLKRVISEAIVVGAVGLTAVGLGAGSVANAAPIGPAMPGIPLPQGGHGHGHGHGWDGDGDGHWNGPWYGPGYWGGRGFISACINASGPYGYVSGSICI
jgi:hypothetical protein